MRSCLLFLLILFCAQMGIAQGYADVEAFRKSLENGERNDAKRILTRIQTDSPSLLADLLPEIENLYDLEFAKEDGRDSLLGLYQTILQHSQYPTQRKVLLKRVLLVETMPHIPLTTRLACYEECYAANVREMSANFLVAWGRTKLQAESWDQVLVWYNGLMADFDIMAAPEIIEKFDFATLVGFFEKELNPLIPDCSQMIWVLDSMELGDGLTIHEAQVILNVYELKWCDQETLAARARKVLENATDANSYRLLALDALNKNQYQKCYGYLEQWIAAEENPLRKVGPSVNLAIFYIMDNRFAEAKRLMDHIAETVPDFGEGWMMQGRVMELAAEQCSSGDFEQKAMYWLAVESYMKAKNLDESLADEADLLIYRLKSRMPSAEEYGFRGLKVGDTYPLKCWGSQVTHVR